MRTVLYLCLYGTMGGAERALSELLAGLDPGRYRPLVVCGSEGPFVEALRRRGVEVLVEPFPAPPLGRLLLPWVLLREVRAAWRLRRLVRSRGIGVAHCSDVLGLLLLLPAALGGAGVLYQVSYLGGAARRLALSTVGLVAVDGVVAYSDDQAASVRKGTFGLGARLAVIRPGLEPEEYARGDGARCRRELGVPDGAPLVGMLARWDTWKGHAVFLEAAAVLHQRRADARFAIVGGALNSASLPHVERYRRGTLRRLEALGLARVVQVVGHRDDVADVLAALDVLVFPSVGEAFGMVLLEALAAGTPVVASDSGGPVEILEEGRSGLLFATGDAADLAERVLGLLDDAARRRRLADAGRARVAGAFHRSRYAGEMADLYDRLFPVPAPREALETPRG